MILSSIIEDLNWNSPEFTQTKTQKLAKWAHFEDLQKSNNMHGVVFDEKSKTDQGYEMGDRQKKC